jgi:hypothetical protein
MSLSSVPGVESSEQPRSSSLLGRTCTTSSASLPR